MAEERRREIMMPVPDDKAVHLLEIEALRQITDNLKRLNEKMDSQGDKMNAMDVRLARIESNRVDTDVADLEKRVVLLEADKNQRAGAVGVVNTIMRSPTLGWIVGAAVSAWALLTGKVSI